MKPSVNADPSSEEELGQLLAEARERRRELDKDGQLHRPNHIPAALRIRYVGLSVLLLLYAGFSFVRDDVYFPDRRGRGVHFHGVPALILIAVMVLAVLNMVSVVLDHYDERNNERKYRHFAFLTEVAAWLLVAAAIVLGAFVFRNAT